MFHRSTLQPHEPSDLAIEDGRRLEIRAPIGTGTSSTVYRAIVQSASGIRRHVAAKIFPVLGSDDAETVSNAIALAAQRSALVHHPNVVETYDYLVYGGQPILLLELIDGVSLAAFMDRHRERQRRVPLDLALFVALEVAEGLSGARSALDEDGTQLGLVHLALTAREVLLSFSGEVKVEGFGLDVARAGTSSVRNLRGVAARANMMAPEVACGLLSDARADVFSLGILLRELLVGPRFPNGVTNAESIRLARDGYVHPLPFSPDLPSDLVQTMHRAMMTAPEDRYPNATAMIADLRRVALSLGVGDLRYFLRRALDRELRDGLGEETQEVVFLDLADDAREPA